MGVSVGEGGCEVLLYKLSTPAPLHSYLYPHNPHPYFNVTFESYLIVISSDCRLSYYKTLNFRKNNKFLERLVHRAIHICI